MDDPVIILGQYETINTDRARTIPGMDALLLGYGCIDPKHKKDGQDPLNPAQNPSLFAAPTKLGTSPPNDPNYIEIVDNVGICPGDSGGAVYTGDAGLINIGERRSVAAINSCADTGSDGQHLSFLVNTSTDEALAFINGWIGTGPTATQVCLSDTSKDAEWCRQP